MVRVEMSGIMKIPKCRGIEAAAKPEAVEKELDEGVHDAYPRRKRQKDDPRNKYKDSAYLSYRITSI